MIIKQNGSSREIDGKLSLRGQYDRTVTPERFVISGLIETTTYLDGTYEEVCAGRLIIQGLRIESESFGSEDNNIVFEFSAESYQVLSV